MLTLLLLAQITAANADQLRKTATAADATSAILALAFSPDGKLVASGEVDKKIRIYDAVSGKQVALLEGHTKQVAAVAFTPDGSTLCSAGYDRTVRLWDLASGKLKETQKGDPPKGVPGPDVDDMRAFFIRDASLLAYGSYEHVWDLKAKKDLFPGSLATRGWFEFDPINGTLVAVSGSDKEPSAIHRFERWDPRANKVLEKWEGTPGAAYERIALGADGATAAVLDTSGDDNQWKIEIWDLKAKKRVATPGAVPNFVNGMAFTRDGSALATASGDKKLRFWHVKAGKEPATFAIDRGFMGLVFSPDGARLATGDDKGGVQIWGLR